jgi:hypothetical protein
MGALSVAEVEQSRAKQLDLNLSLAAPLRGDAGQQVSMSASQPSASSF